MWAMIASLVAGALSTGTGMISAMLPPTERVEDTRQNSTYGDITYAGQLQGVGAGVETKVDTKVTEEQSQASKILGGISQGLAGAGSIFSGISSLTKK